MARRPPGRGAYQWRRVLGLTPEDDLRAQIQHKLEEGLPAAGAGGESG